VPRGVANAVLLRLARLTPPAAELARALSVLGDGAQVGDAARLAGLTAAEMETALAALVSADVISGGTARFTHPILRTAIYEDLSPPERERFHHAAATVLRERGAPPGQIAAHVIHTEPAADSGAVTLLREAARDAVALGDAARAAALLTRALNEPPVEEDRSAVLLELGQALARAGAPEAIPTLSEIVVHGEDAASIAAAAIELSGALFFAGHAAEGAAVLRRAQARIPAGDPARKPLDVTLLGIYYTSASARREAEAEVADLQWQDRLAGGALAAAPTLVTRAMDELVNLGSASVAADLAERALAAGLPAKPHQAWAGLALVVLAAADRLDAARRSADQLLAEARERGAALTVATVLAHRAFIDVRRGDLTSAEADTQEAIDLASDMLGSEFVFVLAVPEAVIAGLDRDKTPDSLRSLFGRYGVGEDTEFLAQSLLRHASGVLRAAAGNHEAAIEELRACALEHPMFGGENPAFVPWRSAAALSLAELGRHEEARDLATDEVDRARSFGAPRALGIALRARALVGPASERADGLSAALEVLEPSPARLEHARVLVDLGATLRAAGQRTQAREPLLEGLALATRCGARVLARRARDELRAIGLRPRTTDRTGADSLTPSERRVADLAAGGSTNREIAQTLFVTEKTIETHLGRAFRKLDISSRRQLPEVLARAATETSEQLVT
jgi:DNA-binding CsgD family transcriptional regulator